MARSAIKVGGWGSPTSLRLPIYIWLGRASAEVKRFQPQDEKAATRVSTCSLSKKFYFRQVIRICRAMWPSKPSRSPRRRLQPFEGSQRCDRNWWMVRIHLRHGSCWRSSEQFRPLAPNGRRRDDWARVMLMGIESLAIRRPVEARQSHDRRPRQLGLWRDRRTGKPHGLRGRSGRRREILRHCERPDARDHVRDRCVRRTRRTSQSVRASPASKSPQRILRACLRTVTGRSS